MKRRPLFDAHCHVGTTAELRASTAVTRMAVMSSREDDWPLVQCLARADTERVVAGVGLHPWHAHAAREGWQQRLADELERDASLFVGEIGLDKVATTPDTGRTEWAAQSEAFEAQMRLAARWGRVVSLHNVHAQGAMLDTITRLAREEQLPPRLCMHSWGGSAEMVKAYTSMRGGIGERFFFSFSATINGRSPKTAAVVAAVPADRLLIESDHEHDIDAHAAEAVALVARARGWSEEETAERTAATAELFFFGK